MFDTPSIRAAMRDRMEMMLAAAREHHLPGSFESWRANDMYATRASEPGLRFLCNLSVTGSLSAEDLRAAIDDPRWGGIAPTIVFQEAPGQSIDDLLGDAGYTGRGWRPMAVRPLDGDDEGEAASHGSLEVLPVPDSDLEEFLSVLLAGYGEHGVVGRFIEAGHRAKPILRFGAWSEGRMIAAAGMTLHGDVASLGGASTLPEARGKGAQSLMLRHRLQIARQAGCAWAVATAGYGTQSARNMERAGFLLHNRPSRYVPE